MALPSTYHQRNALPNRSPNTRPRSLSLAEYQPLSFDREALESAYQATLYPSAATSNQSHLSTSSSANASVDTHATTPSTLSSKLKPGDNPHLYSPTPGRLDLPTSPGVYAGIGAGHSLTPPQSPFHKQGQLHQNALLSTVPPTPPMGVDSMNTPPPQFRETPPALPSRHGRGQSHDHTGLDMDDFEAAGYETDPGPVVSGHRRALPLPPMNVPAPEVPQWEPDYKPHIPPSLMQPSVQNAYAQLSAPPPNLPPRRGPQINQAGPSGTSYDDVSTASSSRPPTSSVPSSSTISSVGNVVPPPGAPSFPPTISEEPGLTTDRSLSSRPRPEAEKEVALRASDRTPIWSTHYLDPCLRNSAVNIPHQVSNITNAALSGLGSGQKEKFNSTIGAPIDGLAKLAQGWVVPPDGRFHSESGGIELGIGVIDSQAAGWGRDKGRRRARVEVVSKNGGIKVDVVEISPNRQIDLKIDSKTGDILVLLPDCFYGPIHINSAAQPPIFLPIIQPQLAPLSNPYNTFFTTFVVPLEFRHDPLRSKSVEHNTAQNFQRFVPKSFREESELFNQIQAGYAGHVREEQDKLVISSQKGRIVVGYRDTLDEQEASKLALRVGAQHGGKKKKWWR